MTKLYHYTSFDTLLAIIKSRCMWATDFRYVNDSSEVTVFGEAVAERAKKLRFFWTKKPRFQHSGSGASRAPFRPHDLASTEVPSLSGR
jgi:hypothetical protein